MENLITKALEISRNVFGAIAGTSAGETDAYFQIVEDAYEEFADYREEVQRLRDFYNGDQITGTGLNAGDYYIPDWPDEEEDEKIVRAERMEELAWNRIRDGVLTHADALYASSVKGAIHRRIEWEDWAEASEENRTWLQAYFENRLWPKNDINYFLWETWRFVGAERGAVVMNLWLDARRRRLRRFGDNTSRQEHRDRGCVWMERLDNLQVIPIPHPLTPRELGGIIRWYKQPIEGEIPAIVQDECYPGERSTVTELITDSLWMRWLGGEVQQHPWGTVNRYGDVRTIFTWFRNPADIADSEDAIAGQLLLLENTYTNTEISRSHAFPETLYVAFDPPMREDADGRQVLEKGPNVAWVAQDPQAKILKVAAPAQLSDVGMNDARIHQMLDEALGLSQIERSQAGQLGQLRSAPALGRLQGRSERRRRRKLLAAYRAERDLFASARDMTAYHCFGNEAEREALADSKLVVTWPPDAFGLDTYTEAQKDQIEVTSGLETRTEEIRKRHPDLTEEEIEALVTEVEEGLSVDQGSAERGADPNATLRSNAQPESQ